MVETIVYNGEKYPAFQSSGNAARFILPFAQEVCRGFGADIGCNRAEWSLPGSVLIDPAIDPAHDAMELPAVKFDYIFSSHCLEHLQDWVAALDHWATRLKTGATLFLYLPHSDQQYWRPWHNRKHYHSFSPETIKAYLVDRGWRNIFVSQRDLNHSFAVIAEKS